MWIEIWFEADKIWNQVLLVVSFEYKLEFSKGVVNLLAIHMHVQSYRNPGMIILQGIAISSQPPPQTQKTLKHYLASVSFSPAQLQER